VVDTGETCDDNNSTPGDGCDASCQVETQCGNGSVEPGEECDEGAGNSNAPDATCRLDCTNAGCGDGIVDTGEQCDDGNTTSLDGCSATCQTEAEYCGDGIIQAGLGEVCDDGGSNSDTVPDACRTDCQPAACGDGVVDSGEECDDGNTTSGDGCSATCVGIVSDDFSTAPTAICDDTTDVWECVDAVGDVGFSVTGQGTANARLRLAIPSGPHDSYTSGNNAPALMQNADDSDFEVQVKMESSVSAAFQSQGIIIESDATHWVRVDFFNNGTGWRAYAASLNAGVATQHYNFQVATGSSPVPLHLRVKRVKATNTYTVWYSTLANPDPLIAGNWTQAGTFVNSNPVTRIGPYAGNAGAAPAFTALFDFFFNNASRIDPEDP